MAPPPIPDEDWETIWAPLEAQGWRHEGVPGGVNYFFPPGVVKGEGHTLRKDYFDSKRQVVSFLGLEIKDRTTQPAAARASPRETERAPERKRKRPTPSPGPSDEGASGTDGHEDDEDNQFSEERRSRRVKMLQNMPSPEELEAMLAKQQAEKAAFLAKWLAAQPVGSHKSEWLGPANARIPPNRETGEPLTKTQLQKIAPHADFHRTWKLDWFNGEPQSKNLRKNAQFNRMYSNRAANGVYGPPRPLLKDTFHGVLVPGKAAAAAVKK